MTPSHPFSKVIHTIWYQGHDQAPETDRHNVVSWRQLNPGYDVLEWNYQNLTEFISTHYPQYFWPWNRLDKVIKKCDFARLLLLHYFGGTYADLDLKPVSPLDALWNSNIIYHGKTSYVSVLPTPAPNEVFNFRKMDTVLSREYRTIDHRGFGLANGIITCIPRAPWLLDFIDSRVGFPRSKVLEYMGPHALTRFFRSRPDLHAKTKALPPYYFLWEKGHMKELPPEWVVSLHPAINSWGDHTKRDFWNT